MNDIAPRPPLLAAPDWDMLTAKSAISPPVIHQRGYQSLPQPEDLIDRGFSKAQAKTAPALGIPLWDVHGQRHGWQIRPEAPRQMRDGKVFKYELPTRDRLILDVHPSMHARLGDPAEPLWITEGVKKGDALVSQGACTIALVGGVWGFRGTNEHGGKVILPDWEYVALNGRLVYVVFDSDLATNPKVEAALKALYQLLRSHQARPGLVHWPEEFQQRKWGVDDFLAAGHSIDDLLAMVPTPGPLPAIPPARHNGTARVPTASAATDEDYPYSDAFNATCLIEAKGSLLRYCPPWKSWLVWSGTHWQCDTTGIVMRWQRQTIKALSAQIPELSDGAAKALMDHIKSSLNTSRLEAAIRQAQSWEGMSVGADVFDTNPWLLNCTNGTLDLQTGTLRPHQQADMLTKCLTIPYEPEAACPTWEAFLWRIMGGTMAPDDPDMSMNALEARTKTDERARALIDFLQQASGYALTGSTEEQCLFILHGPTKTGKSTYLATHHTMLGPYAKDAEMTSFMHKERDEIRNDLADLAGSRFVSAVEAQEGRQLNEALIKQVTGGVDLIKARFLHKEFFEYHPQFKIFLGTNHLPKIGMDPAVWERVYRVPFIVHIPKPERDKQLDAKLKAELPGILAWAVRGCLAWKQAGGLPPTEAVIESTQGYRNEMDILARFLEECCTTEYPEHAKVKATALAGAYQAWCRRTNEPQLTNPTFIAQLEERGYERKRGTANQYYWYGISLISTDDERYE